MTTIQELMSVIDAYAESKHSNDRHAVVSALAHSIAAQQSELAKLRAFKERVESQEPFAWAIQPHGGPVGLTRFKPTAEQFGGVPLYALPPSPVNAELVEALKGARKELHACQAVIHLRGGFDPAYVRGAQRQLAEIDAALSNAQAKLALTQDQVVKFAKFIAEEFPLGTGDWACKHCHPNSDILIEGFSCVPHKTIEIMKGAL